MKSGSELQATIVKSIAEACYLSPEDLRLDLSLIDLGLDSLAITSIVADLEARWQRSFSEDQITAMFQAADVHGLLQVTLNILEA